MHTLLDALRGATPRADADAANSDVYHDGTQGRRFGYRPALEPVLRGRVEDLLKVIEGEAVQLGKDIGRCAGWWNAVPTPSLCLMPTFTTPV